MVVSAGAVNSNPLAKPTTYTPVGVLATMDGKAMKLRAQIFQPGETEPRAGEVEGPIEEGEGLAARLMNQINGR